MPTSATPFPPPPSFYKLYDPANADPPSRPNLVRGAYEIFGAQHHTAPWHDTEHGLLAPGNFMYPIVTKAGEKGSDAREELAALAAAATKRFSRACADAVDTPSAIEKDVQDLYAIFNNAHKVINEIVRPAQAMETLEHALRGQIEQKQETIAALRQATLEAKAAMKKAQLDAREIDGAAGKALVEALK